MKPTNTIITLIIVSLFCLITKGDNIASLPDCTDKEIFDIKRLIFVSTLDGHLTALDANHGSVVWSIKTGQDGMFSSSIHTRELTSNGKWVRMIPSLNGGLFGFDGESVNALPVSADQLLTTTFRYTDDLVFAGGKKTCTYGINLRTGDLMYECNMNGCHNFTENSNGPADSSEYMLIVQKQLQTVRAIVPQTGSERWNFSVGRHEIKIVDGPQCHRQQTLNLDIDIQVVVPEALLYAVGRNPSAVLWKTTLESPIINAWQWKKGVLRSIDMFSGSQWTWGLPSHPDHKDHSPSVYVGMHNKQLYIHESEHLRNLINAYMNNYRATGKDTSLSIPQIPWKPYPAASSAVAVAGIVETTSTEIVEQSATSLSVLYGSEYINGNGYYLYDTQESSVQDEQCDQNITTNFNEEDSDETLEEDTPVQIIIVSLWYWWKEVTLISVTTAIVFNCIFSQRIFSLEPDVEQAVRQEIIVVERPIPVPETANYPMITDHSEKNDENYQSRFFNDFYLIHCLGRGGFGVVFEAKNKIDEHHYAVKRISLPDRKESRDKVMREVKALAKLDHRNIVRYFNAWLEFPPRDWQENQDNQWMHEMSFTADNISSVSSHCSRAIDATKIDVDSDSLDDDSYIVFDDSSESKNCDENVTTTDTEKSSNRSSKKSKNVKGECRISIKRTFLYIQMQLCRKKSLRDWMQEEMNRTEQDVKSYFEQIIHAVEYVHLQGLIHRDLKPSNIFFSADGLIKVGDFGLVTEMENDEAIERTENNANIKNSKHTLDIGTHLYMSPEQMKGDTYNYKVDIYSLGVILFELLNPFATEMERIKSLSKLHFSEFPNGFKEKYEREHELLCIMLSHIPDNRPTTMGVRARPPLMHVDCDPKWHFELPPRKQL